MIQQKRRGHPAKPPALTSDAARGYGAALMVSSGVVPEYSGRGRPPTKKQAQPGWEYLQIVKSHLRVTSRAVFGDAQAVHQKLGEHNSYVEQTHLTIRHTNGRLVHKTLSYSKRVEVLEASWEDIIYNLARPLKALRQEVNEDHKRWSPRTPAMVAGLTDHIWTIEELLTTRVSPLFFYQHQKG